jgi:hypothetical protein
MALCIVFGPDVARTVRKVYLEHNMEYLEEISDLANAVAMDAADEKFDDNPKAFRKWLTIIRVRLEEWMDENEWWKDAAKLDSAFDEDNAAEAGNPVIFKTFVLKDFATEEERNEFGSDVIALSPSGHADLHYYKPPPDSGPFDKNFSIVTSVNGDPYPSLEQAPNTLLEEGSDKRLQMAHCVFAEIFLNPALMIDLGLLGVLKFQIQELKIDVNYQEYLGIWFRGPNDRESYLEGMPLLFHGLVQPDQRLFDYLLSLKRVEANPVLEHSLDGTAMRDTDTHLLHEVPLLASHSLLDEEIDLISRLRYVLERKEVDIDCHDLDGTTPLENVCDFLWVSGGLARTHFDLARLFLSFGAKVTEEALLYLREAAEANRRREIDSDNFDRNDVSYAECAECCRELIVLLTATQHERETEER